MSDQTNQTSTTILDDTGHIATDLPCVNCGYNLRTLSATGICPECAAPVAQSTRGHYLYLAPPRWVRKLAIGALLLIIAVACAIARSILAFVAGLITSVFIALPGYAEGTLLVCLALATTFGVVSLVIGLFWLTAPEPVAWFRNEWFTARRLVRWCALALPVLMLSGLFLTPLPGVRGILPAPFFVGSHAFLLHVAFVILALALVRHVATLMHRIPRPGLVTFAKIEFWGGLASGIVYIGGYALLVTVIFRAFAPLAAGPAAPTPPYVADPNSPGVAATASAPALSSLRYTSMTVTYVRRGGAVTTMPASMPMAMTPPTFSPLFAVATIISMVGGCGMLIVGIAGLVLLILVWRALANAARLAEAIAVPGTSTG